MHVPATQMEEKQLLLVHVWFQPGWIVRTPGPVDGLPAQMERAMASVDPNLPFSGSYSMRDLLAKTLTIQRVEVGLLGVMAALGDVHHTNYFQKSQTVDFIRKSLKLIAGRQKKRDESLPFGLPLSPDGLPEKWFSCCETPQGVLLRSLCLPRRAAQGSDAIVSVRNRDLVRKVKRVLWPEDSVRPVNVWAVLDAAKDTRIFDLVSRCHLQKCCLFAGDLSPQLERSAPYLIKVSPRDSVTETLLDEGWGQGWGVFLQSDDSLAALRRHLRTFLRVKDESGRYLLFRYYDPGVLRIYLPTCLSEELKVVFGSSVIRFHMEAHDRPSLVSFEVDSAGHLRSEVHSV